MNALVNPELAQALARIAELEEEAARAARCAAQREREHLSNSDELFRQIKALKAEIAEGDAADRANNALLDQYEEAIEAAELEIIGERAKTIEAEQMLADAEREITDLRNEMEGIVEEKQHLETKVGELEDDKGAKEDIETAREALIDYLISIGEPINSHLRPSRELQALCDALL